MTLDKDDVAAIAREVARRLDIQALAEALAPILVQQLRAAESRQMDAAYWVALPAEEQKRLAREQRRAEVATMKGNGGSK